MEIMDGGEETPLSVDRPRGMEVPQSLEMNENLYLTIGYLLRNEHIELRF